MVVSRFAALLILSLASLAWAKDDAARRDLTVVAGPREAAQVTDVPPRTIGDVLRLLEQYRPDPAKAAAVREELEKKPPEGATTRDLVHYHLERGRLAESLGLAPERLAHLREAVKFAKGTQEEARVIVQLAAGFMQQGDYSAAIKTFEGLLADWKGPPGPAVTINFALARVRSFQGDLAGTQAAFNAGDALLTRLRNVRAAQPFISGWSGHRENARSDMLIVQGKLADAESALRRSIALFQQAVEENTGGEADLSAGTLEESLLVVQTRLVRLLTFEGKLKEAEIAARGVLRALLERSGKYSSRTGSLVTNYARLLAEQGRFFEAKALADASLEIFDNAGTPQHSQFRSFALAARADAQLGLGDWQAAANDYRLIKGKATGDEIAEQIHRGTSGSALVQVKVGRAAEVVGTIKRLVEESVANLGPDYPDTGEVRGVYAMALAATGERAAALGEFREAVRVLLAPGAAASQLSGLALRRIKVRQILEAYLGLLYDIRGTELERAARIDAVSESFRVADGLRGGSVQQALAASAARAAANQPGLGELIRQEQDDRQEITTLYDHVLRLMSLPGEQQLPKVLADMRARIDELEKKRQRLYADIERRFPDYATLVNPRPAAMEEARKALGKGEALVSVLTTAERSFVWAINSDGRSSFHTAGLSEKDIASIVSVLRRSLDPGDLSLAAMPAFDLKAAHRLYAELFAPAEAVWGSERTLIVSVGGALAQIPLAILPTGPVSAQAAGGVLFGEMREVPWLVKRVAIADVPSVSALVRLRALPAQGADRAAFAGFGDPLFGKPGSAPASATRRARLRNLEISRVSATQASEAASPEWTAYASITPLPDTREEILAIAHALGADPRQDVFLGAEASKRRVRQADLSHRRIVAFATHGLIPGDLPGLDQPALALAATEDPRESPLLTLDDVLTLKLNADWVVLSACNTAAGDGEGAEAVSGLGRGFFYAGTRALLVTHWPVETVSARKLTTRLFERYASDPTTTRAQALRASMLALMEERTSDYSYAHPLFWAPYALIGDAGR